MPQRLKILETKTRIRFHDCDPYNHLNNSKYIDYIISTRGDQLIEFYDFDMYELIKREGVGWAAAETNISYLSPASMMEEVIIQTQLLDFTKKSLQVEGIMWDLQKTKPRAIMWTKLVHFNIRQQLSQEHSPELMEFFNSISTFEASGQSFQQRVKSFRNKIQS